MDISFKCPVCDQELEVDESGAGSTIDCPACSSSITVPVPEHTTAAPPPPRAPAPEPPKVEKHFTVPVHDKTPSVPLLIQRSSRPLEVVAKEGDKKMRIRTFKRIESEPFDETVSAFLEKVGQTNIVSVSPIHYSYVEPANRNVVTDFGVVVVFKG